GDTTINVVSDGRKFALYAKGADSQISSSDRLSGDSIRSVFTVDGDMKAETKGIIDLQMADNSRFTGSTNSLEYNAAGAPNTTTNGTINLDIAGAGSIWNMTADSVLSNLTLTGATLRYNSPDDLSDPDAFVPKTLTVAGDYTGNGGHLIMNTVLNGDDSPTDKLLIKGNSAGTTTVSFVNIGGQGGLTILNGIEVITVDGISDGTFTQNGRIVAGAYDYYLGRGKNGNDKNWYLTSDYSPVTPDPKPKPEPEPKPEPVVRPEAGGYINNLYMANNLFNVRLHDRLGETQYTDVLTGERKVTSLWLRNVAGHSTVKSGDGQLKTGTNRYVVQLGGDIAQWSDNDLNRYHIGLMAGYGRISGKTTNHVTKTRAKSDADGYSAGIYGTYYANEADKSGLYVDSWVQYNWFKNRINGDELPEEKYNSDGITLSAEAGYSFLINETQGSDGSTNRWFIQPKAQVTYMGVKMDTHTERNGTRVSATGEGNIQTRLGIRVYGLGQALQDKDNDRQFQPFAEINWLNNSKMTGVSMDDDHVGQSGTRNIGEIKVGVEGQLTRNADIWFNVAQQAGSDHYSDTQGMLGLKYRF
ncbi:autotransporter outer membrane beta-barrel domain-containing protein, partial [Salmonella enterica subsp. enterica serovar Enteritidis]|nr:autotransporter outer membrane beta-barrel domain-containing protein [Salmonella enterica subsp. enterica serovar Enteritidis]